MLDRRSLNPGQLKTLQEIDDLKSSQAVEEISSQERQFRNLLSDIRLKTDIMRKRKYHQPVPVTRQVPTRGLPSFMSARNSQTEIEQMLKLKVDSNIVKEFLGQT